MSRVYSKTPSGGDIASSVTNKVILASQRCAVAAAVAKARWNPPCASCKPAVYTSTGGNSSSVLLQQEIDNCAMINSTQANQIANQQLRGTTGTNYALYLQQQTLLNYAPVLLRAHRHRQSNSMLDNHMPQQIANLRSYLDIFDQPHKIVSYGRKCRLVYMMHP